jgi:hypothetical protein
VHVLAGPFAAFAVLLGFAGGAKALRPLPTVRALRSVSLPSSVGLVRALGVGEACLAIAALVTAGPIAPALVALSYAGFAAFVGYAMARGGSISSCGCFGKADSAPTALHLVVNVAAALIAAVGAIAALSPARSPLAELADSPGAGVAMVVLVAVIAGLAYLALAEWPRLVGVMREGTREGEARI